MAAAIRSAMSARAKLCPQFRQRTRSIVPCRSTTCCDPARRWSPSTFWVITPLVDPVPLQPRQREVAGVRLRAIEALPAEVAARPVALAEVVVRRGTARRSSACGRARPRPDSRGCRSPCSRPRRSARRSFARQSSSIAASSAVSGSGSRLETAAATRRPSLHCPLLPRRRLIHRLNTAVFRYVSECWQCPSLPQATPGTDRERRAGHPHHRSRTMRASPTIPA